MLTNKKRRVLLWLSVVAFIILLIPVFFYSLGYSLGPNWKLLKSGGIFIKATEAGASVFVHKDGFSLITKKKNTSLLGHSALIENLSAGNYIVKVEKDGFWTWQKKLSVVAESVTAREILSVPTDPAGEILASSSPLSNAPKALKNTKWFSILLDAPYQKKSNILKLSANLKPKILFSSARKFWVMPNGDFLVFGDDGNFYLNNDKISSIKNLSNEAISILKNSANSFFDVKNQRIIFWDQSSINSYWTDDLDKAPLWYKNTARLHIHTDEGNSIRKVLEYPGHPNYFLVAMQNGIFVMEEELAGGSATSADKPNIFPLYKGKSPEIIFTDSSSILIWDDNNFIEIKLP